MYVDDFWLVGVSLGEHDTVRVHSGLPLCFSGGMSVDLASGGDVFVVQSIADDG